MTGGGGGDVLQLTTAGALAVDALTGVAGVPTIQLNAGGNTVTLLNSNLTGVSGSKIIVNGGAGDDTADASGLRLGWRRDNHRAEYPQHGPRQWWQRHAEGTDVRQHSLGQQLKRVWRCWR